MKMERETEILTVTGIEQRGALRAFGCEGNIQRLQPHLRGPMA